jgi:DNA-binding GntR family transcriptional regulator
VARDQRLPYERIVADLQGKIREGELRPGDQLPTVAALCESFSVSRVTVLKALRILQDDGLITIVPRWGSFVADKQQSK